eukprot:EG_transcript_20038
MGDEPASPLSDTQDEELIGRINRSADHYATLSVSREATEADLKKAYRRLALRLHPDKNKHPGAEEAFKKVARAFDTLSDAQKRAQYDRYGEAAEGRPSPPFQSNFQGFQQFHGFPGAQFQQGVHFQHVDAEELFRAFFAGDEFQNRAQRRAAARQAQDPPRGATFQLGPGVFILLLPLLLVLGSTFLAGFMLLLRNAHLLFPILLLPKNLRSYGFLLALLYWSLH